MKRFLLSVIVCLMSCFVFAQTPNVDISIDETTTSTITVSFTKNEYCSSYHYMIGEIGELEMWLQSPMFAGMTLSDLVMMWGIEAETGYIHTFNDLTPNTPYVIYVVVHSQLPDILVTDTTQTLGQGGVGESVISIQVTEITENSARVICTPNEETAEFRDMLIIKDSCLVWSLDSAVEYLKNDPYVLYTVDDHVWQLNPNTTYFVLAIGLNANGVWGELAQYEFTTLEASTSIINIQVTEITENSARVICTPNEATVEFVNILIDRDTYLDWGLDSVVAYMKDNSPTFYEEDDYVYEELNSGTAYLILAMGLNADGVWGELAQYEFTTLAETSVCDFASNLSIYPNPAHEYVNLNNLPVGATLTLSDLQGRIILKLMIQNTQISIPVNDYAKGMYLLQINNGTSSVAKKIVVR